MNRNQIPDFNDLDDSSNNNNSSPFVKSSSSSTKTQVQIDSKDKHLLQGESEVDPNSSSYSPEHLPQDYDTISRHQDGNDDARDGDRQSIVSPLLRSHSSLSRRSQNHSSGPGGETLGYEGSQNLSDALPSIIGLCLHAAADGIAMGATAGSNDEGLKAVVFLAIIVHKAVSSLTLTRAHRCAFGSKRFLKLI